MAVEEVEISFLWSRRNAYNVPQKAWRSWTPQARQLFNEVYSSMRRNQELFKHPKAEKDSREHWKTVCWNAAWTAAHAVSGNPVKITEDKPSRLVAK
jgi:hypothetical protein